MKKNPGKIVILYSSIGSGHISAARAIAQQILQREPAASIVLQDIRAFMNPAWRKIDERLYWFIASHLPESFDTLFRLMQSRGSRVTSLSLLPNDYPEQEVAAFLESLDPQVILATHYGAAQVLGTLREQGMLANVRIGWLHTDFFEGYFPRISKRIDRTFLAHGELESRWLAAGVPCDKVITSGMPVCVPPANIVSRVNTLRSLGLDPDIHTVLVSAGKEGVGDYSAVVESISLNCKGRVQIVAVCGGNARQKTQLAALKAALPPHVGLSVMGLLPHEAMMSCLQAVDLLVTKAGGMTPSEAFSIGIPVVLLDVVSGHERENANMFARLGVAELAADAKQAGSLAAGLLADSGKRSAMLDAQRDFREHIQLSEIVQFALDDSFSPAGLPADFGAENGTPVVAIKEALARLDREVPADIELLLSYSTSQTPQRVVTENPFGHLAIYIDGTVFSANYIADRESDPNFLQHLCLADYLYGVRRPSFSQVHTNTYGLAYGRETIGLRVLGITQQSRADMIAEAHRIEDEFRRGSLIWDRSNFNCADVVARMLHAGGYEVSSLYDRLGFPAMPLDIFDNARTVFESDSTLTSELVAYRQVPGSHASYRFSRFPLSLAQPLRSIARMFSNTPRDRLEASVTRQIAAYFGDRRLLVDDLRAHGLSPVGISNSTRSGQGNLQLEAALITDLRNLLSAYAELPLKEMARLSTLPAAQDIRRLIDRGHYISLLLREQAEKIQLFPRNRPLRLLFAKLIAEHKQIELRELQVKPVRAYFEKLQAFESAIEQEFSKLRGRTAPHALSLRRRGLSSSRLFRPFRRR